MGPCETTQICTAKSKNSRAKSSVQNGKKIYSVCTSDRESLSRPQTKLFFKLHGFHQVWICLCHMHAIMITLGLCVHCPCCLWKTLFHWNCLLPQPITIFEHPLLHRSLSLARIGMTLVYHFTRHSGACKNAWLSKVPRVKVIWALGSKQGIYTFSSKSQEMLWERKHKEYKIWKIKRIAEKGYSWVMVQSLQWWCLSLIYWAFTRHRLLVI